MRLASLALLAPLVACERVPRPSTEPAEPAVAPPPHDVLDERFVATVQDAIKKYPRWGSVDEQPRPAPAPCAAPGFEPTPSAEQVRMSKAGDGPHVAKLFYLYASDRAKYLSEAPLEVGFAVVKESYAPVKLTAEEVAERAKTPRVSWRDPTTAVVDGAHYKMGDRAGLFAMIKVGDEHMDGTDRGWIYAVVDTASNVKAAGRIERCATCHEDATHERMFGLDDVAPLGRPMRFLGE